MYQRYPLAILIAALAALSLSAHANVLSDIFTQGHVDGELRGYDFNRLYNAPGTTDASALSVAALVNLHSGSFGNGFSLTGSFLSANSLGTQPSNQAAIDTTLMGPTNAVNALGQGYLQYWHDGFQARAGYQYLDTPWMGSSDSRVLPASYNAVSASFELTKEWRMLALRSFTWKSRTASGYYQDNQYYPSTFHGDSSYGNFGGLPATASPAQGTWALGSSYAHEGLKAQAWYYNFLRFAHMGYVDGSYTFETGRGPNLFISAQYIRERSSADNILVENQVALFGVTGNRISNRTWGMDAGLDIPGGKIELGYNEMMRTTGAIGDGALISPYTAGYATDPLYTSSMIRGLVETGPGHAWKAKLTYHFLNRHLLLITSYARYTTALRGNSHNLYVDLAYRFDGYLKGLSLRNRWERSVGGRGLNPGNGSFSYNRLMLAYAF
ncbi:MAG TPA: hypothetical protein VMV99_12560 [Rhodanobacter sp.]|nr:hypothetical protein [Rhodanobacter sp.]